MIFLLIYLMLLTYSGVIHICYMFQQQNYRLDFTSSDVDDKITAIEDEVEALKKEKEETVNLLATYADRLEQMDRSHTALNQTVSDLSISLQTVVDDAKMGEEMKETADVEATAEQAEEETAIELAQQMAEEEVQEKDAQERLRKKATANQEE